MIFFLWCTIVSCSCSHRRRNFRSRRHAGRVGQRLLHRTVQVSQTTTPGARPLVLLSDVQVFALLFLQKLCLHALPFVVCIFLRIHCPGTDISSRVRRFGTFNVFAEHLHFFRPLFRRYMIRGSSASTIYSTLLCPFSRWAFSIRTSTRNTPLSFPSSTRRAIRICCLIGESFWEWVNLPPSSSSNKLHVKILLILLDFVFAEYDAWSSHIIDAVLYCLWRLSLFRGRFTRHTSIRDGTGDNPYFHRHPPGRSIFSVNCLENNSSKSIALQLCCCFSIDWLIDELIDWLIDWFSALIFYAVNFWPCQIFQVALDTAYWTFFNFLTIIGSVVFYFSSHTLHVQQSFLFVVSWLGAESVFQSGVLVHTGADGGHLDGPDSRSTVNSCCSTFLYQK